MDNLVRIVAGVAGLVLAGWAAGRTLTVRRSSEGPGRGGRSYATSFAILAATAVVIALTLLM